MFIPLATPPRTSLRPEESKIAAGDWEVLADFWYPIAVAEELRDRPLPAQLLDVRLVVYRGLDSAVATAVDLCPHRHIRLSTGSMVDGEIVCPYHGMRFDVTGNCRLPALGRAEKLPASYRIRTFPSKERYGLIWTCLGNPEAHDVPDVPPLRGVPVEELALLRPQTWPVSAARQVENFFDLGHLPLVHANTIGGDVASAMKPGTVEDLEEAVLLRVHYVEGTPGGHRRPCVFTYRIIMPFTIDFRIKDEGGSLLYALNVPSPTSAHHCEVYQVFRVTDSSARPNREIQQTFMTTFAAVNQQDIDVLSGLGVQDLPLDQRHEVHLPVDNICGVYRARLRRLGLGQARPPR